MVHESRGVCVDVGIVGVLREGVSVCRVCRGGCVQGV